MPARRRVAAAALGFAAGISAAGPALAAEAFGERALAFSELKGWDDDDLPAALTTFRRGCDAVPAEPHTGALDANARAGAGPPRSRSDVDAGRMLAACRAASGAGSLPEAARRFFEERFDPVEITASGRGGFLTGYYEPEFTASLRAQDGLTFPLLTPPTGVGPYPDRAAIEDGALADATRPLAFLDPVDAFTVHVQGSARLRLADGSTMRVGYAGRNGQPYTAVAKLLAEKLGAEPAAMDANRTVAWLKANPVEARELMRANRSYIFFKPVADLALEDGPVGAAGVPLTAGRSLAVDSAVWRYGTPVWIEGSLPDPQGGTTMLARLTVAQDTGAAIMGAARADLFLGTGPEAGRQAGLVRAQVRVVVLRPKPIRDEAAAAR